MASFLDVDSCAYGHVQGPGDDGCSHGGGVAAGGCVNEQCREGEGEQGAADGFRGEELARRCGGCADGRAGVEALGARWGQ